MCFMGTGELNVDNGKGFAEGLHRTQANGLTKKKFI